MRKVLGLVPGERGKGAGDGCFYFQSFNSAFEFLN